MFQVNTSYITVEWSRCGHLSQQLDPLQSTFSPPPPLKVSLSSQHKWVWHTHQQWKCSVVGSVLDCLSCGEHQHEVVGVVEDWGYRGVYPHSHYQQCVVLSEIIWFINIDAIDSTIKTWYFLQFTYSFYIIGMYCHFRVIPR